MEVNNVSYPVEAQVCTHCQEPMDNWMWLRYSGHGPWVGKEWACKKCGYLKNGKKQKVVELPPMPFIKMNEHRGARITSSQAKWDDDIRHRKALPNGDVAIVNDKGEIKEVRPKGQSLRDLK